MVDPIHRLGISSITSSSPSVAADATKAVSNAATEAASASSASPQAVFEQAAQLVRRGAIGNVAELSRNVVEELGQLRFASVPPSTRQRLIERLQATLGSDPLFMARMEQLWLASRAGDV